ncbi:TolC family protein [Adhaeribacter sp. BT258]|uniref:TolC family protein n=1 Tax=Adhaeribacter terrigena TaxID=2793070 RepID=A0ABS1BY74_9BACT|nr:TolC family protein [Adhaeribacter terrigena]MBK0401856.1 TolC family protein [Adhaeribacter terrigena]
MEVIKIKINWKYTLFKLALLLTFGLISLKTVGQSHEKPVLTLQEALQKMEQHYPQLKQYDYQKQAAEARVSGARSWMPPQATFGLSRLPYNPKMIDMPLMETQSGLMVGVEQMIPNRSKQRAKERYLQAQVPAIEQQRKWTLNELRTELRTLYFNRYVSEKMLSVISKSEQVLNLLIKNSEAQYAYNQAQLTNIYSARARLQELQNLRLAQQQMVQESKFGINTLIGQHVNQEFSVDTTAVPGIGISPMLLIDTTADRSDIAIMSANIQAMQANRELMKTELKPEFGFRFEHMPMFNMESMYSAMVMVSIPIAPWSSKMTKAEVKAMDQQLNAMEKERETMHLMHLRMANEKQAMWKLEQERVQHFQEKVLPAYRKALDVNLLAYRQNTANLFVVLDAWEMWQMKEMEYYELLGKALKLEVEYAREMEK